MHAILSIWFSPWLIIVYYLLSQLQFSTLCAQLCSTIFSILAAKFYSFGFYISLFFMLSSNFKTSETIGTLMLQLQTLALIAG